MMASNSRNEFTISLSKKAYDKLLKAKKKGETLSDVVARLSDTTVMALQRRGEKEIETTDSKKVIITINQDKCAGAESCVSVAPAIFSLDLKEIGGFRRGAEPLGMKEVEQRTIDSETIVTAAKSCPYHAINIKDAETGDILAD